MKISAPQIRSSYFLSDVSITELHSYELERKD